MHFHSRERSATVKSTQKYPGPSCHSFLCTECAEYSYIASSYFIVPGKCSPPNFRYVQMPISATFVSSKFANFGNRQHLLILATDDTCQFWQLLCLQNFGNRQHLETDNIYQLWELIILANFGNRQHLPILETDNICQFWQLLMLANVGNRQHLKTPKMPKMVSENSSLILTVSWYLGPPYFLYIVLIICFRHHASLQGGICLLLLVKICFQSQATIKRFHQHETKI